MLQLLRIVTELGALEEVLFVGHTGLVVRLVEAAVACPDIQQTIFASLVKAFHTDAHPMATAPVILALMTYEVFYDDSSKEKDGEVDEVHTELHPFTLHGSLLMQALLRFHDPRIVVKSLLAQSEEELARLSCDSTASHILTAFFTSHTVPIKKKERMTKKLVVNCNYYTFEMYGFYPDCLFLLKQ